MLTYTQMNQLELRFQSGGEEGVMGAIPLQGTIPWGNWVV